VPYELISILVLFNLVLTVVIWRYRWRITDWLSKIAAADQSDLTSSGIMEWARSRRSLLLGAQQDQDLLLAEPEWIPTLIGVLGDPRTVPAKRALVVSALVVLVTEHLRGDDEEYCLLPAAVTEIREALVEYADRSRAAESILGGDSLVVLRAILEEPIPEDAPSRVRDLRSKF
jgi:hypothetical protein